VLREHDLDVLAVLDAAIDRQPDDSVHRDAGGGLYVANYEVYETARDLGVKLSAQKVYGSLKRLKRLRLAQNPFIDGYYRETYYEFTNGWQLTITGDCLLSLLEGSDGDVVAALEDALTAL
jgi:hypothetical protein